MHVRTHTHSHTHLPPTHCALPALSRPWRCAALGPAIQAWAWAAAGRPCLLLVQARDALLVLLLLLVLLQVVHELQLAGRLVWHLAEAVHVPTRLRTNWPGQVTIMVKRGQAVHVPA